LNLEPTTILLDISVFRGVYVKPKFQPLEKNGFAQTKIATANFLTPKKFPDPEIS